MDLFKIIKTKEGYTVQERRGFKFKEVNRYPTKGQAKAFISRHTPQKRRDFNAYLGDLGLYFLAIVTIIYFTYSIIKQKR